MNAETKVQGPADLAPSILQYLQLKPLQLLEVGSYAVADTTGA